MFQEIIHTVKSPFRDDMHIVGFRFGKGEKAACIVGPTRGNEIQQLYICSQLVKELTRLEKIGAILNNNEIMVIPTLNQSSINI